MPYQHLEHDSDIGILGIGATIEEAFEQGALAMFAVQLDPDTVTKKHELEVEVSASGLPELFVELINELLALADLNNLALAELAVDELGETQDGWKLKAKALGEPLDPGKHALRTEVKAATYSGLRLSQEPDGYHIQCVLDI